MADMSEVRAGLFEAAFRSAAGSCYQCSRGLRAATFPEIEWLMREVSAEDRIEIQSEPGDWFICGDCGIDTLHKCFC